MKNSHMAQTHFSNDELDEKIMATGESERCARVRRERLQEMMKLRSLGLSTEDIIQALGD